jgi:hypothetical protein
MRSIALTFTSDSCSAASLRAVCALLVPGGVAPRRLATCQYRNCGEWFLRPDPGRGSTPLYCSHGHANSARVTAYRKRQRKARAHR